MYIVEPSVVVEDGVTLEPFAVVKGNSVLKKRLYGGQFLLHRQFRCRAKHCG